MTGPTNAVSEQPPAAAAAAVAPALLVEGIHAGYGKKEVLHGVTLQVAAGEVVAVIGPNGAGKSTLLKVVAGLVRPTAGRVTFGGADVTHLATHRRARAGIAYLMQAGGTFPSLTAEDHLALGRATAHWGGREPRNNGEGLLLPGLLDRQSDPVGLFSGGERQAVAAAAILATEPLLLLADEPSAGLAPAVANELLQSLATASRDRQLPVLWVEQRVADVLPLVDRAVMLRAGRLVAETSTPQQWLDSDVLGALAFGGPT